MFEGIVAKTDDMIRGVKRGLDELRVASAPESGSGAPQETLRLPPRERRERDVVWRVDENRETH